jgi:hypothetical protein
VGRRLPPGEAERRAKARRDAMYSGAAYKKGAPGNADQWKGAAASLLGDERSPDWDVVMDRLGAKPGKTADPHLAALGLDKVPDDFATLRKAYRAKVMQAFRDNGSDDTATGYVSAMSVIAVAYERLRLRNGW